MTQPWRGRTAVVVQHLSFEDLGSFGPVLEAEGLSIRYLQAGVDELAEPIEEADLLVVLGGPIGVYETDTYPFIETELTALRARLARRLPTLGVCLGAQLMAQALGGRVYPGGTKEIGWSELRLSEAGAASALNALAGVPVLHWHGDTFDLPPGALHLAASALYPNQAFSVGSHALALQFHPEADARRFERWLIGHAAELGAARIDIPALRRDAERLAPGLERAAGGLLKAWLAGIAPAA